MSAYAEVVCSGLADESELSETGASRSLPKFEVNKTRELLLDYLYENSNYLAEVVERVKESFQSLGLATHLTCIDVSRILEKTMIVTATKLEDETDDEQDIEETFTNTVVSEKNIFL